jgi:ketosteroid isomerase-like protein
MHLVLRFHTIVILSVLSGCGSPGPDPIDTTEEDREAPQETDDAWYFGPDAPPLFGKAALEESVRPLYDQYDIEVTMTLEDVRVIGDWAYGWGMLSSVAVPHEPGATLREPDSKYVFLCQRQTDGTWKIAVSAFNRNAPRTPPS